MKHYNKVRYYFLYHYKLIILLTITGLLYNGLMCLVPIVEGNTINSISTLDSSNVIKNVIIFISLVLFIQINRMLKRYLVRLFSSKMSYEMKNKCFNNLLYSDISYFNSHSVGDILNRNLKDIYDSAEGVRKITTEVFDTFILLIGYVITYIILDYKIALLSLIFSSLAIIVAYLMKKVVYKTTKSYKEYLSINKEKTLKMLKNEVYFRGFGVHDRYQQEYETSLEELRKKSTKALLFQSSLEAVYNSIALIGTIFIIYLGILNVSHGIYNIGVFSSILTIYILIARKASKVGKLFNSYQAFKISWNRISTMLSDSVLVDIKEEFNDNKLILKDFSFGYDKFKLPKINIEIKKGEHIIICGRVHSGKSTFLKGLSGIFEYSGSSLLDGVEIFKYKDMKESYITYSSKESVLYNDTILKNITLNREGDLDRALNYSMLDCDLNSLGGLNKVISQGTSNISGGQEKRLVLARSIYQHNKLILLDDPLSSVDLNMALKITDNLDNIDSIIIMATNNKEVIKKFDKIIYLDNDKYYFDTFDNLLKINSFKELMI